MVLYLVGIVLKLGDKLCSGQGTALRTILGSELVLGFGLGSVLGVRLVTTLGSHLLLGLELGSTLGAGLEIGLETRRGTAGDKFGVWRRTAFRTKLGSKLEVGLGLGLALCV